MEETSTRKNDIGLQGRLRELSDQDANLTPVKERRKPADETGKGRRRQSWKDLGMLKSLVFITRTMGGNLMVVG